MGGLMETIFMDLGPKEMMRNHLYYMNIPQYATDSAVELAAYHNSYNSNPGNFPTPAMNGQTLLNTVARNADHDTAMPVGSSAEGKRRKEGLEKQH
ncbi:hypothetical protein OIU85_028840 [Salix viminalis]|uniref:Uncharacterized protein n=1 Tax=Salix viminalis TaxID=40686 RepID=A0A9Q0T6H5_SALVM|nr:hypothetical protein OIU85_028840 [Salix viminalis]